MKNGKLRIAQLGSLWEDTPPPVYGGTERVISFLTEQLVEKGHDVTLFACGTSKTSARLVSIYPRPLFRDGIPWTNIMYPLLNITEAFDQADNFDVIHVHLNKSSDYIALPLSESIKNKVIFTLHFPYPTSQNRTDRHLVLQKYKDRNFTSISNAQREGGENLNWIDTVYNGISLAPYTINLKPSDYFVWIGKFNPDKGVKEAIMAAKEIGAKLVLAGKIDKLEQEDNVYYQKEIAPLIDGKQIQYVGEVNDSQKNELFGNAIAFLNPIKWNEPFGLTMVESMACGTPVIAFPAGAAPEIILDEQTGFLVKNVAEMVQRMHEVTTIDRSVCRKRVEELFTDHAMTDRYITVYRRIMNE